VAASTFREAVAGQIDQVCERDSIGPLPSAKQIQGLGASRQLEALRQRVRFVNA